MPAAVAVVVVAAVDMVRKSQAETRCVVALLDVVEGAAAKRRTKKLTGRIVGCCIDPADTVVGTVLAVEDSWAHAPRNPVAAGGSEADHLLSGLKTSGNPSLWYAKLPTRLV